MSDFLSCGFSRLPFRGDMTVGEALRTHPLAPGVFATFGLGNCRECESGDAERLESVCSAYGVRLDDLLASLNRLAARPPAPGG